MAKVTLSDMQSLPDPLTSDLYELVIGNIPGSSGVSGSSGTGGSRSASDVLRIQCQTVSLPGKTIEPVQVDLSGNTLMFAGRMTYTHDLSITFVENRNMEIFKILNGWAEYTRFHRNQLGHYKADYATNSAQLFIMDQMGQTIETFNFYGLWLNTLPEYSFDGASSTVITAAASFQIDYWETASGG